MYKALSWLGNYDTWTFNPLDLTKDEILVLKEQGVTWTADEIRASQEMLVERYRNMMKAFFSDGSPDNGFLIVGTGGTNDFTVSAGNLHLKGWLKNCAGTTYQGQPKTQAGLTTPGSNRTDVVYLDIWYDEINGVADSTIINPVLGFRTSCRLRLFYAVKVAEGTGLPADGLDGNNTYHWRYQLATLSRLAGNATITSGMVQDNRTILTKAVANVTKNITATTVETTTEVTTFADATSGAISYTLPASGTVSITKTDDSTNAVTILPAGASTVLRGASYTLAEQDQTIKLKFNGTNWYRS
jgi:hypothetical protein